MKLIGDTHIELLNGYQTATYRVMIYVSYFEEQRTTY
jgi:hypothetical protein